jgi:hypothetical protein
MLLFNQKTLNRFSDAALYQTDDDSDWDEEGNVICSGLEHDFQALSLRKQKLYLLQELLADVGFEA